MHRQDIFRGLSNAHKNIGLHTHFLGSGKILKTILFEILLSYLSYFEMLMNLDFIIHKTTLL